MGDASKLDKTFDRCSGLRHHLAHFGTELGDLAAIKTEEGSSNDSFDTVRTSRAYATATTPAAKQLVLMTVAMASARIASRAGFSRITTWRFINM